MTDEHLDYLKDLVKMGDKSREELGVDESAISLDEMVWKIVIELSRKVKRLELELNK